jgi:hypothetical protein
MAVRLSALWAGWPPFTPQEDSWYSFLLEAGRPQGHTTAGRIRSIAKSNDLIGNRTRDLPACSIKNIYFNKKTDNRTGMLKNVKGQQRLNKLNIKTFRRRNT